MTFKASDRDGMRAEFAGDDFGLLAPHLWTDDARHKWDDGKDWWLGVMLGNVPVPSSQVDFDTAQAIATMDTYALAIVLQSERCGMPRDQIMEEDTFDRHWGDFFPDELYVDTRSLPEAFQALVVAPALEVRMNQIANSTRWH